MDDSQAILKAKLDKLFPDKTVRRQVSDELKRYGRESDHREVTRVQLAILKLSGNDVNKVSHNVQVALTDYRDVLYWAEYPTESGLGYRPDADTTRQIRKQDAADYAAWLKDGIKDK